MKLYTEEQVKIICQYFEFPIKVVNEILALKPIELPSNEEIEEKLAFHAHGARWVINRIKQQDNGK